MTSSEKIEALEALRASDGWRVLEETMGAEIEQLTTTLIEGPGMSSEQLEFTRGALFSARRMLRLPDTLIQRTEGEILFENTKETP